MVTRILSILNNFPEIELALIFGSYAKGTELPGVSDLDLAVSAVTPLSTETRVEIMNRLAEALHTEVDIVDLQLAQGLILKRALAGSKIILKKNPTLLAALMKKMFYSEADYMPLYRRILKDRQNLFLKKDTQ